MQTAIAAGDFKTKCLKLLDQAAETREPLVITKHGKAVARLVPMPPEPTLGLDHNPAHPRHAATSASAGRLTGRGRFRRGGGGRSTCASTCSNSAG